MKKDEGAQLHYPVQPQPVSRSEAIRAVSRGRAYEHTLRKTCSVCGPLPGESDAIYSPVHVVDNPGHVVTVVSVTTSVYGPSSWPPKATEGDRV